ncbi:MAG TPA: YggT family protein [Thermomicrobiales bacterium]|jgi:YggT family protein|nr:YggT family protein [Thermomicrobiales bacterium]
MTGDLLGIILLLLNILSLLIIARALFSWFDPGMQTPIGRVLRDVTEPIIGPIRQAIPSMGMFDFSPIVALLLILLIRRVIEQAFL